MMKKPATISIGLHAALLFAALVGFSAPKPFEVKPIEAIQVDISNISDKTQQMATVKDATPTAAKPAPKPTKIVKDVPPAPKVADEVKTAAREPVKPPEPVPPEPKPDPTPPTRFFYGDTFSLNTFRWDFVPNPSVILGEATGSTSFEDASVGLQWNLRLQSNPDQQSIVTYIGQDTGDADYAAPLALKVDSPSALTFVQGAVSPSSFQVAALMHNLSDIDGSNLDITGIDVSISLPKGLRLKVEDGNTTHKTVASVGPGSDANVSWDVEITAINIRKVVH